MLGHLLAKMETCPVDEVELFASPFGLRRCCVDEYDGDVDDDDDEEEDEKDGRR